MNALAVALFVALSLMLVGCEDEPSSDESDSPYVMMDEMTSSGELPSFLGEGLSPEEKAELMDQILPSGTDDGVDAGEKFNELFERANAGDAKSQTELGVMYYTGEAVSKTVSGQVLDNDPGLAAGWLYRAAEQGYVDAQFNLGLLYANGEGVEQDIVQAVELFKKAAEQGNIDAQNNLGALYYTGEGVERNTDIASEWFENAAALGSDDAQANLNAIKSAGQ